MVPTIKKAINDELEDLSKRDFEKFCHQLQDRRDEPRVRRSLVEDKKPWEITNLLVSTFTEAEAPQVAVDTLRQIGCNEEAKRLESKVKVLLDKGDPALRKTSTGGLETEPTQEALNLGANQFPLKAGGAPVKKAEDVEAEAKACVIAEGGDPCNKKLVLSRFKIQFGKYKDQTFKWLMENDLSYAVYVVATHQKEREKTNDQSPWMANKDSLARYALACPGMLREVRLYRIKNGLNGNRATRGQRTTASYKKPTWRRQTGARGRRHSTFGPRQRY